MFSFLVALSPLCSQPVSLSSLPLTFMCISLQMPSWWGHSQKEQSCVVCGNGAELSGAEMAGESANCALLRDNIVMLDYPSACWHCPASPWTHRPAEEQPTANGVFLQRAVVCIQPRVVSHSRLPIKALEVWSPVCFAVIMQYVSMWLFLIHICFEQC